jgi:predicted transcriptional regulator
VATRTLGDQELELLRWVAENGPLTVGQAAERYGADRGLARSTVLTVMERLRRKGRLTRRRVDGVFAYSSPVGSEDLLRGVVSSFVDRALAGSVSPFVAYLAEAPDEVTPEDLDQLEKLVDRLRSRRKRR